MFTRFFAVMVLLISFLVFVHAQELSAGGLTSKAADLPEYIVITSQNTKLIGGIGITIDYRRSKYKDQLEILEELLQNRKKMRIRNQTDLLNAMSDLGFEYVDAYMATASTSSSGDADFGTGDNTYRTNIVFRKKLKFQN